MFGQLEGRVWTCYKHLAAKEGPSNPVGEIKQTLNYIYIDLTN